VSASSEKNLFKKTALRKTLPTNTFNWVVRLLTQSALGKFTTINLTLKFICESPKNPCVLQCAPRQRDDFSVARFFLVWQNGKDKKGYKHQSGWAKKTNKRKHGGANVQG